MPQFIQSLPPNLDLAIDGVRWRRRSAPFRLLRKSVTTRLSAPYFTTAVSPAKFCSRTRQAATLSLPELSGCAVWKLKMRMLITGAFTFPARQLRLHSNEIVRCLLALRAVIYRRNRANHARPFAKSESRGQGGARFCAGFRSHSDSRRFHGRFVKARRGKGERYAACSQDIGRAGKEIGFYCLVAERTHLSRHSRLTNGSASMTLPPVFF